MRFDSCEMLAYSPDARWVPGIGDPTFGGWFTVFAYFACSLLCLRAFFIARTAEQRAGNRNAMFWAGAALFLLLLGINKQLDLQTWFTLTGKNIALRQGWYEDRRVVQALFIGVMLVLGGAGLATVVWTTRGNFRQLRLALVGIVFLGCFIVVRAASMHHVDQMLRVSFGGARVNWILELSGIGFVAAGALRNSKRLPRSAMEERGASHEGVQGETFIWVTAPRTGERRG